MWSTTSLLQKAFAVTLWSGFQPPLRMAVGSSLLTVPVQRVGGRAVRSAEAREDVGPERADLLAIPPDAAFRNGHLERRRSEARRISTRARGAPRTARGRRLARATRRAVATATGGGFTV